MSLQYLLDGYNIIYQMPALGHKTLEEARQGLVAFVESQRPHGSSRNSVQIIFDGKPGMLGRVQTSSMKVLFARRMSADDKIKQLIDESSNPKNIRVVTNDRDICYYARAQGAQSISVQEFLAGRKKETRRVAASSRQARGSTGKKISHVVAHKITKEFQSIWLEKKGRKGS